MFIYEEVFNYCPNDPADLFTVDDVRDRMKEVGSRLKRTQIQSAIYRLVFLGKLEIVERGDYDKRVPTLFRNLFSPKRLSVGTVRKSNRKTRAKTEYCGNIKVEKGFPIPEMDGAKKGRASFPFDEMEVGDSFFVPLSFFKDHVKANDSLNSRIKAYKKKHPRKDFTYRSVVGGFRVWRIK